MILTAAKKERDSLLKEARETQNEIINQAKQKAVIEAEKISNIARNKFKNNQIIIALNDLSSLLKGDLLKLGSKHHSCFLSNFRFCPGSVISFGGWKMILFLSVKLDNFLD